MELFLTRFVFRRLFVFGWIVLGPGFTASAEPLYEVSITKHKPACDESAHPKCWETKSVVWKHVISPGETVLLSNDKVVKRSSSQGEVVNPIVVRLPALYVPIVLSDQTTPKPVFLQLLVPNPQPDIKTATVEKAVETRTETIQLRVRLGNNTRLLNGRTGNWLPFAWSAEQENAVADARAQDLQRQAIRRARKQPDFYLKVRRFND